MKQEDIMKVFLDNLSEEGLEQVAYQLAMYPKSREYILKCAEEFYKAYTFR